MRPFIEELPRHYGRSAQDGELQRALWRAAARAEAGLDLTLEQLFPSTASGWGLALWEEAFGLRRELDWTEERRRARVMAKVRGAGTTTLDKLREVAGVFTSGRVEVEEDGPGSRFVIRYLDTIREILNRADLEAAVNELKPAHLAWGVQYQEHFQTGGRVGLAPREAEHFLLRQENKSWPRYTVEVCAGLLPRVGETFILRQEG